MLLPGKCHGQRSLVGYSPWGHKESDTTEQLSMLTLSRALSLSLSLSLSHTHTHNQSINNISKSMYKVSILVTVFR